MARTREDFLSLCYPTERAAYEMLFADIERLASELGDDNPGDESGLDAPLGGLPLRLRLAFDDRKGCSLQLQHAALVSRAPLLWFFPSHGVELAHCENRISSELRRVREAGVRPADIGAYRADLERANFEDGGEQSVKTTTTGLSDGVSRIFAWEQNRKDLIVALRGIIERVKAY
jgi:hypothetical protein